MPKIDVMNYSIYYEIHGNMDGEPLVVLNGLMMSTTSWEPFIEAFSDYKLVLFDMIDQGRSSKALGEEYTQERQADMIKEFLQKLDLEKIHLMGISYGGEVAQWFAVKYQEMLKTLILPNTTSRTTAYLQDMGHGWEYACKSYDASVFFPIAIVPVYSVGFYEKNHKWMKEREEMFSRTLTPEWYDAVCRLMRSAEHLDLTDRISSIKVPTLIMGADEDVITPLSYQYEIHNKIENSKLLIIKGSGHGVMYEKPYEFATGILGFMKCYDKEINIL